MPNYYPDDHPESLQAAYEQGKEYCQKSADIWCFLCEQCASNLMEKYALTTIALPHMRARWLQGFMDEWRKLPTTGEAAIANLRQALGGREWERIRKEEVK